MHSIVWKLEHAIIHKDYIYQICPVSYSHSDIIFHSINIHMSGSFDTSRDRKFPRLD